MATRIPINQCAFRLDEVATATGGEMFGAPDTIVRGVTIDTRSLAAGALFVALRGVERDGHSYLAEAARRGAAAAIVEVTREFTSPASNLRQVRLSLCIIGEIGPEMSVGNLTRGIQAKGRFQPTCILEETFAKA